MPGLAAALPVIGGVLGVINAIQGIRAQQAQMGALSGATDIQRKQAAELEELQAALRDPANPLRRGLRAEAEVNIGRTVGTAQGDIISRLAASGFRDPRTIAGSLGAIGQAGVSASGSLERQLIQDYFAKRIGLAAPGGTLIGTGAGLGREYGGIATGAGGAVGDLLALLYKLGIGTPIRPRRAEYNTPIYGPGGEVTGYTYSPTPPPPTGSPFG